MCVCHVWMACPPWPDHVVAGCWPCVRPRCAARSSTVPFLACLPPSHAVHDVSQLPDFEAWVVGGDHTRPGLALSRCARSLAACSQLHRPAPSSPFKKNVGWEGGARTVGWEDGARAFCGRRRVFGHTLALLVLPGGLFIAWAFGLWACPLIVPRRCVCALTCVSPVAGHHSMMCCCCVAC